MGSNRFWHIVSVVKERLASLSSRVASSEPIKNSIPPKFVNSAFTPFFSFPQNSSAPPQPHESQRIFRDSRETSRTPPSFYLQVISVNVTNPGITIALAAHVLLASFLGFLCRSCLSAQATLTPAP